MTRYANKYTGMQISIQVCTSYVYSISLSLSIARSRSYMSHAYPRSLSRFAISLALSLRAKRTGDPPVDLATPPSRKVFKSVQSTEWKKRGWKLQLIFFANCVCVCVRVYLQKSEKIAIFFKF